MGQWYYTGSSGGLTGDGLGDAACGSIVLRADGTIEQHADGTLADTEDGQAEVDYECAG